MAKDRGRKGMQPIPFPARSVGERSEPERSAGNGGAAAGAGPAPNPEVEARPAHRRFTAEYKLRILREAEACGHGGIGAILRREGLYSGQLSTWRRQQEARLSPQKRGRKANGPLTRENARLEKENRRLAERLRKAEIIIHVQKKLCDVLGLEVPPIPEIGESE